MKFLNFNCRKSFKTSGSISYELLENLKSDAPLGLGLSIPVWSSVGTLDLHYVSDTHVKAYVRVMLPVFIARDVDSENLRIAVEEFLESEGLSSFVTYSADLISYDLITQVSRRIDEEGNSDGIGS